MMKMQKKSALSTDKNDRRRGRPAGKNRTPLSLEERRARNAQYERERRNATADAMAQLAEAANCDPQIANAELLATVISQLQRRANRKLPQDIKDLRRANDNLESQIASLQSRLGQDIDVENTAEELSNSDSDELSESFEPTVETVQIKPKQPKDKVACNLQSRQSEVYRSKKIRKTSKSSSVRERTPSGNDTRSDSESSSSDWSESVKTKPKYKPRKRSQKVSEQTEYTTSTYSYRTESESSLCGVVRERPLKIHSDDSNQTDASEHPAHMPIDPALLTIPEQTEFTEHYDLVDDELLETLTEGEKRIINEWIDGSEPLNDRSDHVNNQVLKFLDFDDFLLDINA